jgi:dCTP deaminase
MTAGSLFPLAKPEHDSGAGAPFPGAGEFGSQSGLLPREKIEVMVRRGMIISPEIEDAQFQPASLDLRLGERAYRVRASFLPGKDFPVRERLDALTSAGDEIRLDGKGAVLERGCVYVVPLMEHLKLPDSVAAVANPKSSTGRLDIFTRLITDKSDVFDRVARGYEGPLYAEVAPRSFSVRVRKGSKLNQIRFRLLEAQQLESGDFGIAEKELRQCHEKIPLVDGELDLRRGGLLLRAGLGSGSENGIIGYKAQKHTDILDVDRTDYNVADYWVEIRARRDKKLILDPGEFYILASRERLQIPPDLAAEMVPIDPAMGEFRVHYAGFFDPGFGAGPGNRPSARAVLEVRSYEVPFFLEDGQVIGRLVYEKMAEAPRLLYGTTAVSNYQGQGLKLSKHFRMD